MPIHQIRIITMRIIVTTDDGDDDSEDLPYDVGRRVRRTSWSKEKGEEEELKEWGGLLWVRWQNKCHFGVSLTFACCACTTTRAAASKAHVYSEWFGRASISFVTLNHATNASTLIIRDPAHGTRSKYVSNRYLQNGISIDISAPLIFMGQPGWGSPLLLCIVSPPPIMPD
eukprot:6789164-Pyramimonas_sp.AAC.1